MYKSVIVAALVAGAAGLGAAIPAQGAPPTPCSYNDPSGNRDRSVCGTPNLQQSINNSLENLRDNFDSGTAADNLKKNLDSGTAADNLKKNLGLGGGDSDSGTG
jgi:hypothetical protein